MKWKIDTNILAAFLMLVGLVGTIGGLYMNQYVFAIILGSIYKIASNNSLPVSNGTLNFLSASETSFFSTMGKVNAGASFAGGLITVGVVLLVFGGFVMLGTNIYRKYKKGGNKGDMGY